MSQHRHRQVVCYRLGPSAPTTDRRHQPGVRPAEDARPAMPAHGRSVRVGVVGHRVPSATPDRPHRRHGTYYVMTLMLTPEDSDTGCRSRRLVDRVTGHARNVSGEPRPHAHPWRRPVDGRTVRSTTRMSRSCEHSACGHLSTGCGSSPPAVDNNVPWVRHATRSPGRRAWSDHELWWCNHVMWTRGKDRAVVKFLTRP